MYQKTSSSKQKNLILPKKIKFPPPFLIQGAGVIIGIARTEGNANYR